MSDTRAIPIPARSFALPATAAALAAVAPRLGRLRRFASLARHHPERVTEHEYGDFVSAGFSEGQAMGLLSHLAHRPLQRRVA